MLANKNNKPKHMDDHHVEKVFLLTDPELQAADYILLVEFNCEPCMVPFNRKNLQDDLERVNRTRFEVHSHDTLNEKYEERSATLLDSKKELLYQDLTLSDFLDKLPKPHNGTEVENRA